MTEFDTAANMRRFDGRRQPWELCVRWPNGAPLALSMVLNIEEGAELSIAASRGSVSFRLSPSK